LSRTYLVDLDGVCYLRGEAIPGTREGIARLREDGGRIVFLTNNSYRTPEQVARGLGKLGIDASPSDVITSSMAAAATLQGRARKVMAMGGPGLRMALGEAGMDVVSPEEVPVEQLRQGSCLVDAVVVGVDIDLSYLRLQRAARAARAGAVFVATNTDNTYPTESGLDPGAGSIVVAVAVASGCLPEVAGKPEEPMARTVRAVLQRGGGDRRETPPLVIGDRIETDIEFAGRWGFDSALVLTGVCAVGDLAGAACLPHYVARRLDHLFDECVEIAQGADGSVVIETHGPAGEVAEELKRAIRSREGSGADGAGRRTVADGTIRG